MSALTQTRPLHLSVVGLFPFLSLFLLPGLAFPLILPGTGLVSANSHTKVVVFEHSVFGTGGLVLNQPTPICLRDLKIPRFQAFGNNTLMLGCGLQGGSDMNVAMGDMAPWFWIHTCDEIPKSSQLEGSEGALYMGGSIEEATRRVQEKTLDPFSFKFFYKYMKWKAGELERQIDEGRWNVGRQDPIQAVRPYSLPIF